MRNISVQQVEFIKLEWYCWQALPPLSPSLFPCVLVMWLSDDTIHMLRIISSKLFSESVVSLSTICTHVNLHLCSCAHTHSVTQSSLNLLISVYCVESRYCWQNLPSFLKSVSSWVCSVSDWGDYTHILRSILRLIFTKFSVSVPKFTHDHM